MTPPVLGETAPSASPRAADRWLAGALFFLSGALGLGYQLVWVRKAALVVGASQIALATVLTSFFLGMALGSAAAGRWLRSPRLSPLAVYGLCEIGIGGFALAFPFFFAGMDHAYAFLYDAASVHAAALFALRFSLLFLLFLPPTFLMGATLPLLLDGLVARDREVGALTSLLYAINVLGAVAGVLVTSYFAIPTLGMNGTSLLAGVANLAVGTLALAAFRGRAPLHGDAASASSDDAAFLPDRELRLGPRRDRLPDRLGALVRPVRDGQRARHGAPARDLSRRARRRQPAALGALAARAARAARCWPWRSSRCRRSSSRVSKAGASPRSDTL